LARWLGWGRATGMACCNTIGPMLLEIETTHQPATDLGYLLHKHPGRVQTFSLAFGEARVFYPRAEEKVCSVVLLVEVDPVRLVRGGGDRSLEQYVNDRPYVASSMLAVAIAQVFGTALAGACKERPELVRQAIPFTVRIPAIACGGATSRPRATRATACAWFRG